MKNKRVAAIVGLFMIIAVFTACGQTAMAKNTGGQEISKSVQPVELAQNINRDEAMNVVKHTINLDYSKYKIDLINDNLKYKGQQYFQFLISNSEGAIEPSVIVSKANGEIYCYYPDKTVTEVYQDQVFKSKC
jgi:hypothetical protein